MKLKPLIAAAAAIAPFLAMPPALAEGSAAICEFYNHGDFKRDLSGPCTIAESDANTVIKLKSGDVYTLTPEQKRKGHFIDQDGNRADIKRDNDYKRTYRWKNQRLIVQVAE